MREIIGAHVSRIAVAGFALVCLALPITFLPVSWAVTHDQDQSAYRLTTLAGVPIGTIGMLLSFLALVDITNSEGKLRGKGLALATIVLGVLGAASAAPLILGALFRR